MIDASIVTPMQHYAKRIPIIGMFCWIVLSLLTACEAPSPTPAATIPLPTAVEQTLVVFPTPTLPTPTQIPTHTRTPGPSPTSTALPNLEPQVWSSQPIMIEAAHIIADPLAPFSYTPMLILYGDGMLVKRTCKEGECRYMQSQLDQEGLCRLVNAVDQTGFLNVDSSGFDLPGGTGEVIRLHVQVYSENTAFIPDLDRWAANPDWYQSFIGCMNCYSPPHIDPAFIDLYRLLTTYAETEMTGLNTERLAIKLSSPIIAGEAQPWPPDLIPLSELAERSACPGEPNQTGAVILEGPMAQTLSSFLASSDGKVPIFIENSRVWQVHSRWLLPHEMPNRCETEAGLYPPDSELGQLWQCLPEMGAIPTSTATITPTPSVTPTPLR